MDIQKEQAYASCFLLPASCFLKKFILSIMLVKPVFVCR